MSYFDTYTSNSIAGSGNQLTFSMNEGEVRTGRVFYKITHGGTYPYSLLFSNTIDSTYADGSQCRRNVVCPPWRIHSARVARVDGNTAEDALCAAAREFTALTFNGNIEKQVAAGELFHTDAVTLTFEAGEYLCLELTFSGTTLPYHEETLLPVFTRTDNGWEYGKEMPFASMIGCARPVTARIGFVGDSITQGIGTPPNAYTHWNALLAQRLGDAYACWNLGLGFGRANDLATCGAWMAKAVHNDIVVVCYGVNDLHRCSDDAALIRDLERIIDHLKQHGCRVVLQTVPPFDYTGEHITHWHNVNRAIRTALVHRVDAVFDAAAYLQLSDAEPHKARYGGHPDETGCRVWADALYDRLLEIL